MAVRSSFDVVVVGGGIAGSVLAGVLARSGVQVLVAEKERRFRDRIRGESTYPWGVAEAARLGVGAVFEQAGAVELVGMRVYEAREPVQTDRWAASSLDGWNEAGFPHPRLQEAAFCWAASMGAAVRRPMKVTGFSGGGVATVTVTCNGRLEQVQARLAVGADGKMASTRRWTGGQSAADPEHHRFGGVAVSGVRTDDRDTDNLAGIPGLGVNWFAQGAETTRLYLNMTYQQLRASRADRSFDALIAVAAKYMPEGALDGVRQEGPIGFFSNADTWATQIAGHDVVLIGDAAGSLDPTQGLGTSQLFRDVRELSDLLLCDDDWPAAIREYAERRKRYFAVLRQYDLWRNIIDMDASEAADRLREGNKAAAEADPTLGGFALIEARGPNGLVADASARAAYFGTTLVPKRSVDQSLPLTRGTVFWHRQGHPGGRVVRARRILRRRRTRRCGYTRATHMLLVVHGWLPWRLWTFLDDAHSRGALRQAGTQGVGKVLTGGCLGRGGGLAGVCGGLGVCAADLGRVFASGQAAVPAPDFASVCGGLCAEG